MKSDPHCEDHEQIQGEWETSEKRDDKEAEEEEQSKAGQWPGVDSNPWLTTTSAPEKKAERVTPCPNPDQ